MTTTLSSFNSDPHMRIDLDQLRIRMHAINRRDWLVKMIEF